MAGSNIYSGSSGLGSWYYAADPTSELGQEGDNGYWNTDAGRYEAVNEARKRAQLESDRDYELRVKQLKQQASQIAIQKGQAAATEWYNREMVKLSKAKLAEEQRQFNVTSSGYLENGNPTLEREKYQNQALYDWTKTAVDLASTPEDWVKYKRYTNGAQQAGQLNGLNWQQGGQQGSQTFNGQQQSNSLQHVLSNLGYATSGTGDSTGQQQATTGQTGDATGTNWAQTAYNQATGADATGTSAAQTAAAATTGSTGNNETANWTNDEKQLYSVANEFARNPQQAAPGWWESLDDDTKKMLKGAAEAQGHSWSSVMNRLGRATWGWAA